VREKKENIMVSALSLSLR